ncbi:ketoacyl-synt-domain-containing protein [Aspergillus homomorphus CBS 101889]|uniref:Ketoacyl-synt-domain-containing protein n=1 Tax=Aspergillus homomorphus (strain CBS 101889) TaxID=1450537 RepID=A0A395IC41_ASPHC|nr:ketoacyl-synt-domain-containing protein [Aspergillus homomorphus CBS 101889]RAL17772.1 ketoacyl-synt-domain-containing protein [Aspergillus homomorphus CBS 101889]
MRTQISTMEDPIVVVGFSLKFPQDADSSEGFWNMLHEGRCAMTEFPADRFNIDAFEGPKSATNGTMPLRGGHFLKEDLGVFDAPFFNVTPAEAEAMDPQQRLLLETSYRALENAGVTIGQCAGSKTSVYTATFTDDYKSVLMDAPDNIPKYAATGLSGSMLANRISWFYDFRGPSMNLDSACSSSLSALHIACQDLHAGTSTMALVGGCNLVFHPDFMLIMSNMGFLSTDSRCQSFDHKANGYARGDGIGVVVIKKLSQALADGDTIRAVIRATGLNQDGRTPGGITQPSGDAQRALIEETFAKALLDMQPVRFFEAHGTGTAIGDPTESHAIGLSFLEYRSAEDPLFIGAVKSNIGHLEGGSGIAGLIKTIMILERGVILPNSGLERINPKIDTQGLHIQFPTAPIPWPSTGLRRACVNSFGFGGSNAVVVLDDALNYLAQNGLRGHHRTADLTTDPTKMLSRGTKEASPPQLLVWSAADEKSLRSMLGAYEQFFADQSSHLQSPDTFVDLVHTLTSRRTRHNWRSSVVTTKEENLRSLQESSSKPVRATVTPGSIAYIFTGQGAQYARMGHGLLAIPFFRNRVEQLDKILGELQCGWSLLELIQDPDARVDEPEYSQTYSTALQIAVVDFFMHVGVVPSAVVGHSSGEIAAAYCGGAISDRTALRIAFHRGRLAQRLPHLHAVPQGMLAAAVSVEQVQPYMSQLGQVVDEQRVQIGCVNSPTSITLTGDKDQLEWLRSCLEKDGHFTRMLRVNVAYHSTFMESIKEDYLIALQGMDGDPVGEPLVPMISTVTGQVIPPRMLRDPAYWISNMVSQVRFASGIALLAVLSGRAPRKHLGSKFQSLSGIRTLLEIGPHSTLQGPLRDIVQELDVQSQFTYDHALNRKQDAGQSVLQCIGRLWSRGHSIDLRRANGLCDQSPALRTDLPEYPFNHTQRHWFEDRLSSAFRFRTHGPHELLGILTVDSNPYEARWRNILRLDDLPWLADHQISDSILFPAAGMLAMVIEAAQQLVSPQQDKKTSGFELREIRFLNALQVPDSVQGIETQVTLSHAGHRGGIHAATWYAFKVFTFTSRRECVEHAHGTIRVDMARLDQPDPTTATLAYHQQAVHQARQGCETALDSTVLYSIIRENGVNYGPKFQTLENLRIDRRGGAVADIHPCSKESDFPRQSTYVMHPATMDGLLQLVFPALNEGGSRPLPAMVPSYVKRLAIAAAHPGQSDAAVDQPLVATTRSSMHGSNGTQSDVVALSKLDGQVICAIDGYETKFVASVNDESVAERAARPLHSQVVWLPDLDLMTNEQIRRFCTQALPQDGGDRLKLISKRLARFTSLLTHKNPLLRVLHIGGSTADLASFTETLSSSSERCPWFQYDYIKHSQEELAHVEAHCERLGQNVRLKSLQLDQDPTTQGFEPSFYDLVVISQPLTPEQDMLKSLNNIRGLVKPDGRLILMGVHITPPEATSLVLTHPAEAMPCLSPHNATSSSCSEEQLSEILARSQFTGIEVHLPENSPSHPRESGIVISRPRTKAVEAKALEMPPVLILTDGKNEAQAKFAEQLRRQIQSNVADLEVSIAPFLEAVTEKQPQGRICISLLEYHRPFLATLTEAEFNALKEMLTLTNDVIWLVRDAQTPRKPEFHLVDGFARSLRSENGQLKFVKLALTDSDRTHAVGGPATVVTVLQHAVRSSLDDMEFEYEERNGLLEISRVVQSRRLDASISRSTASHHVETIELGREGPCLQAKLTKPGFPDSMRFEEVEEMSSYRPRDLGESEILVHVHAVGVSHGDYLIASGQAPDDETGMFSEGAGEVLQAGWRSGFQAGDRVLLRYPACCRTFLRLPAAFAAPLPPQISFVEAAALPTAGLLALYALRILGRISPDDSVLVRHAANGVGQVAVQLAQLMGAKVIVTEDSQEKREMLRAKYSLSADLVLPEQEGGGLEIVHGIRQATPEGYVDLVLNFDSKELEGSLNALAPCGTLINLSLSRDLPPDHHRLVRDAAARCITLATVDLSQLHRQKPTVVQKLLRQLSQLMLDGSVVPVTPLRVLAASDVSKALQIVQRGQTAGKVVLDLGPGQSVSARMRNKSTYQFNQDATYVIAGGFGGLGRSICRWMASRGVRNLLVLSRSGARSEPARQLVQELSALGVKVVAPPCDIIQPASLAEVLKEHASTLPPIRGCFQCTMVLRDAVFTNMTYEDFIVSTRPKVFGSWNLHSLLPKGMDFFVLLSSIGGVLGAPSQANYCAGNTYKDALARYRVQLGEPAAAIDLGMMVGEGVVAETAGMLDSLRRLGYFMEVSPADLHALLTHYCGAPCPSPASPAEAQVVVGIECPAAMEAKGFDPPYWMHRPYFRALHLVESHLPTTTGPTTRGSGPAAAAGGAAGRAGADAAAVLRASPSVAAAAAQIVQWVVAKLAQILGLPAEEIAVDRPVHANGINSLVAVELRNWFGKRIGADVAVFEILGNMTLAELSKSAAEKTRFRD